MKHLGYTLPGGTKGEFVSNTTKCCAVARRVQSPGAQSPLGVSSRLETPVAGRPHAIGDSNWSLATKNIPPMMFLTFDWSRFDGLGLH